MCDVPSHVADLAMVPITKREELLAGGCVDALQESCICGCVGMAILQTPLANIAACIRNITY